MKDGTLKIILGGVVVEALFRDGTKEEVKVRQLPIRLLADQWARSQGDEAKLVELYCDKPEGWDDNLLPESHVEIIDIGSELNRPMFARWTESRRAEISEMKAVQAELVNALSSETSPPPAA